MFWALSIEGMAKGGISGDSNYNELCHLLTWSLNI